MKARLYINKENLKYNVEYIKSKIGKDKKIIAMVKANAYGAGDELVANELQRLGIADFGVANVDEALRLRKSGVTGMILITSVTLDSDIEVALANDISLSVSDYENIIDINENAKKLNKVAKIHIKIDTGMTRLGFSYNEIVEKIEDIKKLQNISVEGIYTHLSCADFDDEYTKMQFSEFERVVNKLKESVEFKYIHILNSDGTQKYFKNVEYTHVRVGIMLYGYTENTKPILKLTAPVIHINNIEKYTKVGYGGTFIAKPNMKIAVLKIGYADGLSRKLSNNISVEINGKNCPIVGNICMDMCMVDVTNLDNVKINDEAVIWNYTNNLKDIADKSGKIVYEVISNLGTRIERIIE